MSKKIIAVNAGPRKGWNTDTLIMEAAKGAESAGAEVQKFDLFRLEKYTGCIWPWTMFDPESKKLRHETVFPQHQKQVFELGAALAGKAVGI